MPQNPTPSEMIKRLVGFDTTSRESNLALIGFVAEYLGGLGIKSDIIHDESGNKANLHAVIGPLRDGGVSSCRGTPTWCRWTARRGPPIRSWYARPTASSTAAAPPT